MSLETVRAHLAQHGRADDIRFADQSTATVAEAAEAFGVEAARIAKTLSFALDDENAILVVMAGDARTDNAAFKAQFGRKASMLKGDEVERLTGHAIGGVCPFANPESAQIWLDRSLQRFETVFPAAGTANTTIELTPAELEEVSGALGWVTVSKLPQ